MHGKIFAFMLNSRGFPNWSVRLETEFNACLHSQVFNQELPLELEESLEPRVPWRCSYRNSSPLGGKQYDLSSIACHYVELKNLLYLSYHRH